MMTCLKKALAYSWESDLLHAICDIAIYDDILKSFNSDFIAFDINGKRLNRVVYD